MSEAKSRGRRTAGKLNARLVATSRHSGSSYTDKAGRVVYRQEILWDLDVPGLGLRLLPSGRRSWVLHYRVQFRPRLAVLGSAGVLTLDQARRLARAKLVDLDRTGKDPLPRQKRGEMLTEVSPPFLESCRARGVKASTLSKYREAVKLIEEDLGHFAIEMLDHLAARRAFTRWTIQHGPYSANRALQVLRALLQFARQAGWRDPDAPNPADGIKKHKENRRGREITMEEMARIGAALDREEALRPEARDTVIAIRLLLLTGARRREITGLTWDEVDLSSGCLRLKDSKTGAKVVPLNTAAMSILAAFPRSEGRERVFPADLHEVGFAVQYTWERVRAAAGVSDLRLHDGRHNFVTKGLAAGFTDTLVGKAVGHRSTRTTARYEHLRLDPVRQVSERIGAEISASLAAASSAPVVEIISRRNGPRRYTASRSASPRKVRR